MISVAREKAFLSNKVQAIQKNLSEQAYCLVLVIVREVPPPEISEVSRSQNRERRWAYVKLQRLPDTEGKAPFTSGTCRLKTALNLCLTSLRNTLSTAAGGVPIVTRTVVVNCIPGVCLPPTGWQFITAGGGRYSIPQLEA